ncbi:MAG TPA: hypothetical protein VFE96_09470 [Candidatus Bathyarchaeia archaeon]|nr:hypothetical protein [Candidatus Bathyarchaeia archaeon]
MSLREQLIVNLREHLAVYALATLANVLLSIPQYIAVNTALELGIIPKGTTQSLISIYGSSTGLFLDFLRSTLIFQGIMALLLIGVIGSTSNRTNWKWQYTTTGVLTSIYLAYHLGGKFLNALGWIELLQNNGLNISNVYADLFWFGLGTTICYLVVILVFRRSYDSLAIQRGVSVSSPN